MKKLMILSVLLFAGISMLSAQARPKADAPKTVAVENTAVKADMETASVDDPSIEKRVDEKSGKTFFVRKSVDASTGEVSYTDVEYCTHSGKFVNVSPQTAASCQKDGAKAASCCAKGAKASKSCCSGKSAGMKASCAGKTATETQQPN